MINIVEKARGEWQEWMRRPDNAEDFSLDDVCKWMNERPVGAFLLLADEITRLRATTQWRPIESAPKDGRQFLVWDIHYGVRIGRAHIRADHDDWLSYMDAHKGSSKGGIRATHWLPLPPPPAMNQEGGE